MSGPDLMLRSVQAETQLLDNTVRELLLATYFETEKEYETYERRAMGWRDMPPTNDR